MGYTDAVLNADVYRPYDNIPDVFRNLSLVAATFNAPATVSFYQGASTTPFTTVTIAANSTRKVRVDSLIFLARGKGFHPQKSVHVVSDVPIFLYSFHFMQYDFDAAFIFPTYALGHDHYSMSYHDGGYQMTNLMVVATEDNTTVNITPTMAPFPITLQKGDAYQVVGTSDYTGRFVSSDKPVAFFSGNTDGFIPKDNPYSDILYEQIPPISSWGKDYVLIPFQSRVSYSYRIVAAYDNTVVNVNGNEQTINSGEFITGRQVGRPAAITTIHSNKRILVAQFSEGGKISSYYGDPFMIIIPSVEQTIDSAILYSYPSTQFSYDNYVSIIADASSVNNIRLDGNPVTFTDIPGTDKKYASLKVSSEYNPITDHSIYDITGARSFVAYAYEFSRTESVGYGAGYNLGIYLDMPDTLYFCQGSTVDIDAEIISSSYTWSTGETTRTIQVSTPGNYWMEAVAPGGNCTLRDTTVVLYYTNLIDDILACNSKPNVLTPNGTFTSYLWNDGSTGNTLTVVNAGEYWLEVQTQNGCTIRDSANVTFQDNELFGIDDILACNSKPIILTPNGIFTSYLWNDGSTGNTLTVVNAGEYWLEVQTQDGCTIRDTINVAFQDNELFGIDNTWACNSKPIVLTPSGTFTSYLWNDGSTGNTLTVVNAGEYWLEVQTQDGCIVRDTINVLHNIDIFSIDDTAIQCFQTITIAPNFTYNSYLWNDGSIGSSLTINQPGIYWLEVTHSCGTFRDTIIVSASDDNIPPVLNVVPVPPIISLYTACDTLLTVAIQSASDNCTIKDTLVQVTDDNGQMTPYTIHESIPIGVGSYTLSFILTDFSNNADTVSFPLQIIKPSPPQITTIDTLYYYQTSSKNTLTVPNLMPVSQVTDPCLDSFYQYPSFGQQASVGEDVLIIATDKTGNRTQKPVAVKVLPCLSDIDTLILTTSNDAYAFVMPALYQYMNKTHWEQLGVLAEQTPIGASMDTGEYVVDIKVRQQNLVLFECLSKLHVYITRYPELISPNGDGFNDRFVLDFTNTHPNNRLIIFDRAGKVVFEVNNYGSDNYWDGTDLSTGKKVPIGAYYFEFRTKQFTHGGAITVIY